MVNTVYTKFVDDDDTTYTKPPYTPDANVQVCRPNLTIQILCDRDVIYDKVDTTCTIIIDNEEGCAAYNVNVTAMIPTNFENTTPIQWTFPFISGSGMETMDFTMLVVTDVTSDVTKIVNATVTYFDDDNPLYRGNYSAKDNYSILQIPRPDIIVVKDADENNVQPGQTVTFTVNITNEGNSSTKLMNVTDILPENWTQCNVMHVYDYLGAEIPSSDYTIIQIGRNCTLKFTTQQDLPINKSMTWIFNSTPLSTTFETRYKNKVPQTCLNSSNNIMRNGSTINLRLQIYYCSTTEISASTDIQP